MGFTDRFKKNKENINGIDENQETTIHDTENCQTNDDVHFADAHGFAEEVVKLKTELEEQKKRNELMLRVLADKDNQIKSSAEFAKKDIQIAKDDYAKKFVGEIAPSFSTLFRAIHAIESKFGNDIDVKALSTINENIKNEFKKLGVEFVKPAVGEIADSNKHNILTFIPNPEMENGQIADVISFCWTVGNKVVKCADVIVVKND
jgi:molecular chaperone GrpE (heat shock protein)